MKYDSKPCLHFNRKKKGGGGGKKGGRKYEPVNSDSENDHYDDFDPKNPFGDDEIEQFHNDKDKVNCSPNYIYIYKEY